MLPNLIAALDVRSSISFFIIILNKPKKCMLAKALQTTLYASSLCAAILYQVC